MNRQDHIEPLDGTSQDIGSRKKTFGVLPVIFAGDFPQTLPRGTRAEIIKLCLKASPIRQCISK